MRGRGTERQTSAERLVGIASRYPMIHRCGQSARGVRKGGKKGVLSRYQRRCHQTAPQPIAEFTAILLCVIFSAGFSEHDSRICQGVLEGGVGGGRTQAGQTYALASSLRCELEDEPCRATRAKGFCSFGHLLQSK